MSQSAEPANAGDELVDIVDELDVVVGQTTRRQMRAETLRHRAVYIAVRNAAGELLVHQRSHLKDVAPGFWDVAVGGVVGAGESYDVAAVRELAEEIGLHDVNVQPLGGGSYDDEMFKINGRCYLAVHEGPFTFADGEVIAARWVDAAQLRQLLATTPICADSVALILPLLQMEGTK